MYVYFISIDLRFLVIGHIFMMKLQIALDSNLESALRILEQVHSYIDIIEVGTPLIYREGMSGVRQIAEKYPNLEILADLKIMDAGEEEASIAFEAGAKWVTVMGVTNDATIKGAVKSARRHHGQIMIDMMQVQDLITRGKQLVNMGCDSLCVHTAYDIQSTHTSPYRQLEQLREHLPSASLGIAGGVKLLTLDNILPFTPNIIIVGGAITGSNQPAESAQSIYERIQSYENR